MHCTNSIWLDSFIGFELQHRQQAKRHIRKNYNHRDVVKAWRKILDIIDEATDKAKHTKNKNSLGIRTTFKAQRVKEHVERAKSESTKQRTDSSRALEIDDGDLDWDIEIDTSGWSVD